MIIIVTSLTPDLTRIGPDRSVGKFLISLDHEVISCDIYIHWEHIYGHVLRVIILGSGNVAVLSTFSKLSDTTETKSTLNIIKYHYLLYKK